METELLRLWNLVSEITDQLNQNRLATERLQSHAEQLNEQAGKVSDVTLRRFNTDLSKELLTSELERLSVALIMENQSLLHENKQLNSLLEDYDKTLNTVMEKFRGHSHAAQTHEITLIRHYEMLLAQERTEVGSTTNTEYLANLSGLIARALRAMEGRDSEENLEGDFKDREELQEEGGDADGSTWQGMGNWAEEREIEIQRLECENAELRRILGISQTQGRELGLEDVDEPPLSGSPTWNRRTLPFPFTSSGLNTIRDDGSRGRGTVTVGHVGEQRRPGIFGRGGLRADIGPSVAGPQRVLSPPNDIPWAKEDSITPVTESI